MEAGGKEKWGASSPLAYKYGKECIDDRAVEEIWRLTVETEEALGLWQRIYPHRDASNGWHAPPHELVLP